MWQKVGNRIMRQGTKFWSTLKFKPKPEEIGMILDMAGGEEIYICRAYKNMLLFRDNEFVKAGPFFYPERTLPKFITNRDAEYIYWMLTMEEFSVEELAQRMHPHTYHRGIGFRSKSNPFHWAPTEEELIKQGVEDAEEYDYTKLARMRTGAFVYVKAKNSGWVEGTQYGKWRYCGKGR